MSFLRHWEIYRSDETTSAKAAIGSTIAPGSFSTLMEAKTGFRWTRERQKRKNNLVPATDPLAGFDPTTIGRF